MVISKKQIREDLKNIRYYFSRKKIFDNASNCNVGENSITQTIETYNKVIPNSAPRLYDLYISLYVENNTQDSLSDSWGYSSQHISKLNVDLINFFYKEFNKENSKNEK